MTRYAYFKGEIVPIEQAKVSIMTHALNYGTACFEGIRAYWNDEEAQLFIFRPIEHYQRMLHSAKLLFMSLNHSAQEMTQITIRLLQQEGFQEDAYIRPIAYKSSAVIGVRLHDLEDDLAIFCLPFGEYIQAPEGARVGTSSWRRVDDNAIPARAKITGAYINSAFAKTEAALHGYDEAITLTHEGHVSEGSAENIFIARNGKLITPPVTDNILEGITRDTLIHLAREEVDIEVEERPIDRSELYAAEEILFCGTGVQVVPVIEVDRRPVGNGKSGPVSRLLRELYADVVCGRLPRYRHWCVPVYPC